MSTQKKARSSAQVTPPQTAELESTIRQRAYEIYEASGRGDGHDLDHWLQAEAEVLGERAKSAAA